MSACTKTPPLEDRLKKDGERLEKLEKSLGALVERLDKTPAYPQGANPQAVFGLPHARTGENALTSRGFSFLKMFGVLTGFLPPESAKVEMDVHAKMHKALYTDLGGGQGGFKYSTGLGQKFLAPLSADYIPGDLVTNEFRHEMKSLVAAGTAGTDPDEMAWLARRTYGRKDLSWLNETTGGALVAPAQQGELIELLRNKEALVNAGARTVPLPPQGRLVYPRQTSASTAYWVGENAPITQSDVGTGEVILQARKLAVRIVAPNELIRFASPAAEALIRDDMTKTLALGLDLACLQGAGGDNTPLGIINRPNINRVTSSSPGANGDQLVGRDIYRMMAAIEESNAEMEGWIMRPKTQYRYYQLQSDAVAQGDQAGPFLFDLIRAPGDGAKAILGGYPVTKSTQVSQNQTKGSASNLSYIAFGMWSDFLIGMFGGIEFAATNQGDTPFTNDQTWIRGILTADCAPRHEAAFGVMDQLIVTG